MNVKQQNSSGHSSFYVL